MNKAHRLCLVLGDQLSFDLASLKGLDAEQDTILLVEVMEEASHVPHHPQKIALVFSAMRHFADALKQLGHCHLQHHRRQRGNGGVAKWLGENLPNRLRRPNTVECLGIIRRLRFKGSKVVMESRHPLTD